MAPKPSGYMSVFGLGADFCVIGWHGKIIEVEYVKPRQLGYWVLKVEIDQEGKIDRYYGRKAKEIVKEEFGIEMPGGVRNLQQAKDVIKKAFEKLTRKYDIDIIFTHDENGNNITKK